MVDPQDAPRPVGHDDTVYGAVSHHIKQIRAGLRVHRGSTNPGRDKEPDQRCVRLRNTIPIQPSSRLPMNETQGSAGLGKHLILSDEQIRDDFSCAFLCQKSLQLL